ncbi:septal ring lytic transglycosylase RlpA family protein [Quisquiliibacterium transsilvanicum]|uniref:Endolytic peptidoglycan transglycosylase RlpA n=1 Tax=Quisquiliibacterium transsilvanicum TaxID=1549638 RepID=A0A7W8HKB8_9BURK|nr:septal ring lytic transglycosylase RlpA family protein [Quisquiliibacterium transsilvanicum]MBB5273036.1 rare lipoprotein A [Quisquiliibacterium transsilvanicum]
MAALLIAAWTLLPGGPAAIAQEADSLAPVAAQMLAHEQGRISFYAQHFAGRATASGELFDPEAMTMAHPHLPFGTLVRVTTLNTGRSVVLTVNDRGPFHGARIADVSPAAARLLGMIRKGLVRARLEVLDPILSPTAGSPRGPSRPAR